jgi:hypothetical protein
MSHRSGDDAPSEHREAKQKQQGQNDIEGKILCMIGVFAAISETLNLALL